MLSIDYLWIWLFFFKSIFKFHDKILSFANLKSSCLHRHLGPRAVKLPRSECLICYSFYKLSYRLASRTAAPSMSTAQQVAAEQPAAEPERDVIRVKPLCPATGPIKSKLSPTRPSLSPFSLTRTGGRPLAGDHGQGSGGPRLGSTHRWPTDLAGLRQWRRWRGGTSFFFLDFHHKLSKSYYFTDRSHAISCDLRCWFGGRGGSVRILKTL